MNSSDRPLYIDAAAAAAAALKVPEYYVLGLASMFNLSAASMLGQRTCKEIVVLVSSSSFFYTLLSPHSSLLSPYPLAKFPLEYISLVFSWQLQLPFP